MHRGRAGGEGWEGDGKAGLNQVKGAGEGLGDGRQEEELLSRERGAGLGGCWGGLGMAAEKRGGQVLACAPHCRACGSATWQPEATVSVCTCCATA